MRCKVGELAIGSDGGLCEILEWVGTRPNIPYIDLWRVRLLSGVQGSASVTFSGVVVGREHKRFLPGETCFAPDAALTPLRGDPDAIDEHTEAPTKIKEPA